jgi:streptogramin lyase
VELRSPRELLVWLVGLPGSIGRITTNGVVTTYTDPSINTSPPLGITAGPDGALWFTNLSNNSIGRITTSGVVSNYTDPSINYPQYIAAGPDGALWFANSGNNSMCRARSLLSWTGRQRLPSAFSQTGETPTRR